MARMARFTNVVRETEKSTPYIKGPGRFAIDVVGESHYQDNLDKIAGPKRVSSVDKHFRARLFPETDNAYDNMAVRVEIGGKVVGHLDKSRAREHRKRLSEAGLADMVVSCEANVRGGWKRKGGDEGSYGVWLDLPVETRKPAVEQIAKKEKKGLLERRVKILGLTLPVYLWFVFSCFLFCCILIPACVILGALLQ